MMELNRFLRHLFAPIVTLAVGKGWLPEYMQGDVLDLAVIATAWAIPYGISWYRDVSRGS